MDQLRRALEFIRQNLRGLDASKKLLIASLVVIMLMTLFLVSQYAAKPKFVPLLPGVPVDEQLVVAAQLRDANLKYTIGNAGQVMVPQAQYDTIFAQLGQNGQMPANTEILFDNLVENQSWTNSRTQNQQLFALALQNELSKRIRDWTVIRSASVVIDAPEPKGLGGGVRMPTAAVTAMSANGGPLPQDVVDAIARYVAGAKSGLTPANVEVIDASSGQARRARDSDGMDASSYLETAQKFERLFREKIYDLVADIPGVIVQVTAEVDVTKRRRSEHRILPKGEGSESLPRSEITREIETFGGGGGLEASIGSNVNADIRQSGGGGGGSSETDDQIDFENAFGQTTENIIDNRGSPTRLVATIGVPRSYVVGLMSATAAPDPEGASPAPTEQEIQQFWDLEKERIKERVDPHLQAKSEDGTIVPGAVVVALVSAPVEALGRGDGMPGAGGGGTMGNMLGLGGDLLDKGLLVALAGVALTMMLLMVRRTGRKVKMPSADELIGIPPSLSAGEDIVGEAEVSDSPLAGLEVDEEQLRTQKVLEQVSELIHENPELAGNMLGRWVAAED